MKTVIDQVIEDLATRTYPLLEQDEMGYRVDPCFIVHNEVKELRIAFDGDPQDFKVYSKDGSLSDTDCQIVKSHMVLIVYPHLGRIGQMTYFEDKREKVRYDNNSLLWGGNESQNELSQVMTVGRLNELNRMLPEGVEAKLGYASPWGSQTEALKFYARDNEEPELLARVWWDANSGQWESGHPIRGTSYYHDTPEQFIREEILRGELDKPTEERIKTLRGIFGGNVTIEPSSCEPGNQYFDGFKLTAQNRNTAVIWKYPDGSWGAWNKYPKISKSNTLEGIAEIIKDTLLG